MNEHTGGATTRPSITGLLADQRAPSALITAHLPAVLVGGPIAKHGNPIAAELGDMGR